jgi:hypothetical protein
MLSAGEILKTDQVGRVRTPRSRREELLEEFERSGLSGIKFAAVAGIKYQTFAAWVARRRKERLNANSKSPKGKSDPVRWVEAVVDQAIPRTLGLALVIHLPGGARMEVADGAQASLAVHLLKLLEKGQLGTC